MTKSNLNLTQIFAIVIFSYSCIVMVGWIFNIDALTRILPNEINMKFTSALAFSLSGIALWFIDEIVRGDREVPQVVLPATTILILLIMATLFTAGIFGVQTGISELFVKGISVKTVIPGMPSVASMINFILVSIASIVALFESPRLKQRLLYFGVPIMLLGIIACVGYLIQIPLLYYKFANEGNPIAFNAALMFVLLGFGLIRTGESKK